MEPPIHLAHFGTESAAFGTLARAGALDVAVPSCPGWDAGRLVGHLGRVHRWTAGWITGGAAPDDVERPPRGDAVVDWYEAGLAVIGDALATVDPAAGVQTWAGPMKGSFWPRRMAHEAAVHRWDLGAARGDAAPVAADLAVDGIDELVEVFVARRLGRAELRGQGETMHLHATDIEGEWLFTFADDGLRWDHAHTAAGVTVAGTASDLLLLLWNRVAVTELDVAGDASLLARWRDVVQVR